jgi:hypothetical protein
MDRRLFLVRDTDLDGGCKMMILPTIEGTGTEGCPTESGPGAKQRAGPYTYALVTAARNEAQFIDRTIKAVVAQTVRPARWVIVSDGSTDGTDDIVNRYAAEHRWIELIRMPERRERHFAGKVHAFKAGFARVRDLKCDAIGNLDADVSFGEDYFSYLLAKLAEDPALGLVGTPLTDRTLDYDYHFVSIEHVSGPCQLFRRECYDDIGGYVPIRSGGVDHMAVITARMKGWQTRTFTGAVCVHNRPMGLATHGILMARLGTGVVDYSLGSHPVWELCRTAYQMRKRPYVVGAVMLLAGYVSACLRRMERPVSREFVEFHQGEQMRRLWGFLEGMRTTARAAWQSYLQPSGTVQLTESSVSHPQEMTMRRHGLNTTRRVTVSTRRLASVSRSFRYGTVPHRR